MDMSKWQAINVPNIRYHLEQIEMWTSQCERNIKLGNVDRDDLGGYIGELQFQLKGLNELYESSEPEHCEHSECIMHFDGYSAYCADCGETVA